MKIPIDWADECSQAECKYLLTMSNSCYLVPLYKLYQKKDYIGSLVMLIVIIFSTAYHYYHVVEENHPDVLYFMDVISAVGLSFYLCKNFYKNLLSFEGYILIFTCIWCYGLSNYYWYCDYNQTGNTRLYNHYHFYWHVATSALVNYLISCEVD